MKIKDRPEYRSKSAVLSFRQDATVFDAVSAMNERNYGAVVVVDAAKLPIGIVTERDVMRRLVARSLDSKVTTLAQIMTKDLKTAKEDDNFFDWLRIMSNERFRHLPIVNDAGALISIMSQGDFVSYTWPELIGRLGEQSRHTFMKSPSIATMMLGMFAMLGTILVALAWPR